MKNSQSHFISDTNGTLKFQGSDFSFLFPYTHILANTHNNPTEYYYSVSKEERKIMVQSSK